MIVIDASVAVKWLLPEEGSESARELLTGIAPLVVPEIARIEVPGAVLRKLRAGLLDESEAKVSIELWNDLVRESVRIVPMDELLDRAIQIAITCSHPLTDCLYVAAAVQLDAKLLTADAALHNRCRRAHKKIGLLGAAVPH